jgi:hypothetical protein
MATAAITQIRLGVFIGPFTVEVPKYVYVSAGAFFQVVQTAFNDLAAPEARGSLLSLKTRDPLKPGSQARA